jgi:DNA-binding GntR family transcriptional regulator
MARKVRKVARTGVRTGTPVDPASGEVDGVVDRICDTLASAISVGALKPGSKIMDDVVADHFGVSRTVVRGALDILQRDHLIERKRNRGAFVAEPSVTEAEQLFEARYGLEREILALVVERASEEGLDELDKLNEEEAYLPDNIGTPASSPAQVPRFHVELAKLGGNDVFVEILGKLLARVSLVNSVYKVQAKDNCGDHRNIISAIRKRDLTSARRLMEEHLTELVDRVKLDPNRGDLDSFVAVLETFSAK